MKVGNKTNQSLQGAEAARSGKTDSTQKSSSSKESSLLSNLSGESKDRSRVSVSDRAQAMQKAKEIASSETVDEAKIARLQSLIDSGKYKVDSKAIADRLVDEQFAMSGYSEE